MAEKSRQIIGKYEILEKLGEGGFGIVYKAKDSSLDRIVALKQLKMELSSSPEYLERFKRESRLMGSLNHPNIVKMLEVFEDSGRYFIVMDYMPNGSLDDKLKDGKSLSLEETVEILKPVAKAIDYAHGKNLIHRDIKPSNILFMEGDDEPALSDFGLVKSLETNGMTTTGVTFGTPEYMSPEQILGKDLTLASDLYPLGVVAYQMLTGGVPFTGNTPFEIQEGHVHKEFPNILEKNGALPNELQEIFTKILAKNPENRYTTAKEFLQDIDQVNDQLVQELNKDKLIQIQNHINKKEFRAAIELIIELLAFRSSTELKEKLKEYKRREKVWTEYQNLTIQVCEINSKLSGILDQEKWIDGEEIKVDAQDLPKVFELPEFLETPKGIDFQSIPNLSESIDTSDKLNQKDWKPFWVLIGIAVIAFTLVAATTRLLGPGIFSFIIIFILALFAIPKNNE